MKEGEGHKSLKSFSEKLLDNLGDGSCLRTSYLDLTWWDVLQPSKSFPKEDPHFGFLMYRRVSQIVYDTW